MLRFDNCEFYREPYPFGIARGVWDEATYQRLIDTFPSPESGLYLDFQKGNLKKSLSQINNFVGYLNYLESCPEWLQFHDYMKSQEFLDGIGACLLSAGIELEGKFSTRFEFSALPADGGCMRPHTDIPSKVVTLVLPMLRAEDWQPRWGGGTDILRPLPGSKPLESYKAEFEEFERCATVEYQPNQALVFIRNDVSWHAVAPIRGPQGKWRLSATVNIERAA